MSYGKLNPRQRKVVAKYVRGQIVHDLGAGECELSRQLLKFGASEVYAIDKGIKPVIWPWPKRLHYKQAYFRDVTSRMDTVFLSWPVNHYYEHDITRLLHQAETILYLGKNTDGSACGTPAMFKEMVRRELLDYEPDKANCLVVVGKFIDSPREPTGEELAGLTVLDSYRSYMGAEAQCP